MKLAYLTGTYPRATDTFIQREVEQLRRQGFQVQTCSVRRPASEHQVGATQRTEQARTYYLLPVGLLRLLASHLSCGRRQPRRYWQTLWLAWRTAPPGLKGALYQLAYFLEAGVLAEQLQTWGIQHLHNHIASSSCTVAMLAASLGGYSFSFTLHGPHIFFEPHRWRLDEKIRRATFVACISHFCRSQGMLLVSPEYWPRLKIIHCGVDPSQFTAVHHQGVGKRLLYVGRLAAMKGLPVLFEALKALQPDYPDLQLTVIGDGEERPLLEATVQHLHLDQQVQFVGYRSQEAVRAYLQATDIFVLPSFAEGVPVVLMEAMAAGVPVLTSQIAGIPELVEPDHSGLLVPPGDAPALAAGLRRLITDPALRQRLGATGQARVAIDYNLATETEKLGDLFRQALGHPAIAPTPPSKNPPFPSP